MPDFKLSTVRARIRHVRRGSKIISSYRFRVLLAIAAALVVVLGIYGFVYAARLSGDEKSVEIYLGAHLVGRIEKDDLDMITEEGRPCADLERLLNVYSATPLVNENVLLSDGSATYVLPATGEGEEPPKLVLDGQNWLCVLNGGKSVKVSSIMIGEPPP